MRAALEPLDQRPTTGIFIYGAKVLPSPKGDGVCVCVFARLFDQKLRAHLRLDIKWTLKYFPSARSTPKARTKEKPNQTQPS